MKSRNTLGCLFTLSLCGAACSGENPARPFFSWDTVPLCIHFGKTSGPLTDGELKFVAERSSLVCLEKGHAADKLGSTERGIAHDAGRLKELNPRMKVLFYWNAFLNYPMYDACNDVAGKKDWIFRDKDGKPIYKTRKLEQYNLLNAGFRNWWASVAGKAVSDYGCDGIFMDAVLQPKRPLWLKKGWGEDGKSLITEAVRDMMRLAKKKMGKGAILLYNGIRSNDRRAEIAGREYLDSADGTMIEHFGAFSCRRRESMAADIESMIKAGRAGKIVVLKGWPDPEFNWTSKEKMELPDDKLAEEAKKKITFSLACFLVGAREYSYFCYSWGYREDHGSLVDYPELSRPLGKPKGDAKKEGWVYTRDFEHASVRVDLSNREAKIEWKGEN